MADKAMYDRALTELTECERRAGELRTFLRVFEQFTVRNDEGSSDEGLGRTSAPPRAARDSGKAKGLSQVAFNSALSRLFDEVGRPLSKEEIATELERRGVRPGGKDPVNATGTKLTRARELFRLVPGRRYWPVGRSIPEATEGDQAHGSTSETTPSSDDTETLDHLANGTSAAGFPDTGMFN